MNWKTMVLVLSLMVNAGLVAWLFTGGSAGSELYAQNRTVSGGGYVVTTALLTSSRKALWVFDQTEKKLLVYAFPATGGKRLEAVAQRDLRKDFGENLAGDLLVVPGQTSGAYECVYVLDPVGKKLAAYEVGSGKEVDLLGTRDVGSDFKK